MMPLSCSQEGTVVPPPMAGCGMNSGIGLPYGLSTVPARPGMARPEAFGGFMPPQGPMQIVPPAGMPGVLPPLAPPMPPSTRPDLQALLAQVPGLISMTAASSGMPLHPPPPRPAAGMHNVPGHTEALMDCPQKLVGLVIGKGGETIKDLQSKSGCSIQIDQNFPDGAPRKITIKGTPPNVEVAKTLVLQVLSKSPLAPPATVAPPATPAASLALPGAGLPGGLPGGL